MEHVDIYDLHCVDGDGRHAMDAGRLIVVDDEPDLRSLIAEYLGKHGFTIRTAADGSELDAHLSHEAADLLILDVNMPGEDGFAIARRIRAQSALPILMLTAADDIVDRVVGLEIGADDYLTKPFDLRELRARIRALLRRAVPMGATTPAAQAAAAAIPPDPKSKIRFGNVVLDLDAHRLIAADGTEMMLTATEFDLLEAFARHPNRVLSREQLLDLAHDPDSDVFDRSIDIRIARIRRKVEQDPANPQTIKTVRGSGYMFVPTKP
jgi:two-component system phosphate regulon response regulator OmpR